MAVSGRVLPCEDNGCTDSLAGSWQRTSSSCMGHPTATAQEPAAKAAAPAGDAQSLSAHYRFLELYTDDPTKADMLNQYRVATREKVKITSDRAEERTGSESAGGPDNLYGARGHAVQGRPGHRDGSLLHVRESEVDPGAALAEGSPAEEPRYSVPAAAGRGAAGHQPHSRPAAPAAGIQGHRPADLSSRAQDDPAAPARPGGRHMDDSSRRGLGVAWFTTVRRRVRAQRRGRCPSARTPRMARTLQKAP